MNTNSEFAENVLKTDFLCNCGKKTFFDFDVELVDSEKTAMNYLRKQKWENLCLDIRGDFTEYLCIHHKEEYREWNNIAKMIKSDYIEIIQSKIEKNWNDKETLQEVKNDMNFNLLTLFLLNYYREYYSSEFYNKLLSIYLSGHLPCGWIGKYPNGKIVVY